MNKLEQLKRMKQMQQHFQNLIDEYGWASHYVPLDEYHINYHTHGLYENYEHPDLQITLPLDMNSCQGIAIRIIADIKKGKFFEIGQKYYGYLKEGYPIEFKEFVECDRQVFRVILCDQNKKMPNENVCDKYYKKQYDILDD